MKTNYDRTKTFRAERKQDGWLNVSQMVPPQLAKELKAYMKAWRLANPNAYNRIKW